MGRKITPLIYIVAGEASGDAIGARLIEALEKETETKILFAGLGGIEMIRTGKFKTLFPIEELSVMGLVEVLPHVRRILRRVRDIAKDIESRKPDIVITIDSPSFSARVAKLIFPLNICTVQFVAPTVWAWRPWRVHKFKRYFDFLITILPFESIYFERVGLRCKFVGHPVIEYGADNGDGPLFRKRYEVSNNSTLIALLPGSRSGEIKKHIKIFAQAVERFKKSTGDLTVVIPTLPEIKHLVINKMIKWDHIKTIVVESDEKYDAMAASNLALAASGTVALELAIAKVPTVVSYRVNPITALIFRFLTHVRFVNILNLFANREIVPELLQEKCVPNLLSESLITLIGNNGSEQIDTLAPYIEQLKNGDILPSNIAARFILDKIIDVSAGK